MVCDELRGQLKLKIRVEKTYNNNNIKDYIEYLTRLHEIMRKLCGIGSIISILAAPSKYNSLSLLNPSKVKLIQ